MNINRTKGFTWVSIIITSLFTGQIELTITG